MSLFPIVRHELFQHYKNHLSVFWVTEEIDLSKDERDWKKLNDKERYFLKNILAFFAGSDSLIMDNLAQRFMTDVQYPEAKQFYAVQIMMEAIHSEMYSLLIDTYIEDKQEKIHLLSGIDTIPVIKKKAQFCKRYIESEDDFSVRLIAFLCVEAIFFSGAFCSIYWIKERGILPGLTLSNSFISRDEGIHVEFAITLYRYCERIPMERVWRIISEAVNIESQFIVSSIPCNLIGMNSMLMSHYIEYCADRLLVQLGYSKLFNVSNPFEFMERLSLENKTNFFESRVSEYGKSRVGKSIEECKFDLNSEF